MKFLSSAACLLTLAAVVGCGKEEPPAPVAAEAKPETKQVEETKADETVAAVEPQAASEIPGLAIGEKAPEFELADQTGQPQSLSKLLADGPVAVVFYRSADW